MKYCLFQWRKKNNTIFSDRISLKYLKIKLETFSFRCKLYDLKINLYAKYIAVETQEY